MTPSGSYINEYRDRSSVFSHSIRLLLALVEREITSRYRRSILGIFWMVLQPLFYMVIFLFLRSILGISTGNTPYVIFSYAALVPWTFLSGTLTKAGTIVVNNVSILKKIAVQKEVFPAVGVVTGLVEFSISFIILIGMAFFYKYWPNWNWLWLIPLTLLLTALAMGCSMLISAIVPYRGDIGYAIPLIMQVWMYGCPIIYPLDKIPNKWLGIYKLNPMVGIIEGFRNVIIQGAQPDFQLLVYSLITTVIICLIAPPIYRYMSQFFADVY